MMEKGNTMLRHLLVAISLAAAAQIVLAAEAGKVIFVAGKGHVAQRDAVEGAPVQEGDMLSTGADGFIYIKTIDKGLFILRPNTRARIVAYHVDAENPANTRIKLELLSGVARSRSGEAVKLARQNFRFNTPVAAIGVRGTDFTVFTDQNMSRVAVISGGIVVSGFAGACSPDGIGPCEGTASRELSSKQRGQLLQVQRGQAAPQLMQGGTLGPDHLAPPRGDEPIGKNGGVNTDSSIVSVDPSLDAKKRESINQALPLKPAPPALPPPVVETTPANPAPPVAMPERAIVWGRWQPLLDAPAKIDLAAEVGKSELVAISGNYALLKLPGKEYVPAERGTVGFALKDSEAYIYTDTASGRVTSAAQLTNGELNVDFGKKTFATKLDLINGAEVTQLHAQGALGKTGRLHGDQSFSRFGYMNVQGQLSNNNGGAAAYIFDARLDAERSVNGAAAWQ